MRLALGATQHGTTKSVTTNDQREGEGGARPAEYISRPPPRCAGVVGAL